LDLAHYNLVNSATYPEYAVPAAVSATAAITSFAGLLHRLLELFPDLVAARGSPVLDDAVVVGQRRAPGDDVVDAVVGGLLDDGILGDVGGSV